MRGTVRQKNVLLEMDSNRMTTKKMSGMLFALLLVAGCSSQRAQVDALGQCDYAVESVRDVRLGGRAVENLVGADGMNLTALSGIALALLRKDLPLEARVDMRIANPNTTKAAINSFKYLIEMQGKPLFEGTVEEDIRLEKGESTVVPLTFRANIFEATQEQGMEHVLNEIFTKKTDGFLVLKIKPSIKIAGQNIYYPGYITVDRNLGKRFADL